MSMTGTIGALSQSAFTPASVPSRSAGRQRPDPGSTADHRELGRDTFSNRILDVGAAHFRPARDEDAIELDEHVGLGLGPPEPPRLPPARDLARSPGRSASRKDSSRTALSQPEAAAGRRSAG